MEKKRRVLCIHDYKFGMCVQNPTSLVSGRILAHVELHTDPNDITDPQ